MTDVTLPDDARIELTGTEVDERTLRLLEPILDIDVEAATNGHTAETVGSLDVDRLARVMALYRSIAEYRYDWRRGEAPRRGDAK